MVHSKNNMKKWQKEQVDYFKKYLDSFEQGSKEHNLLNRAIKELEKTL